MAKNRNNLVSLVRNEGLSIHLLVIVVFVPNLLKMFHDLMLNNIHAHKCNAFINKPSFFSFSEYHVKGFDKTSLEAKMENGII